MLMIFLQCFHQNRQEMVTIIQKYANDHKNKFSTSPEASKSRTKGIVFTKNELSYEPAPILNGSQVPSTLEVRRQVCLTDINRMLDVRELNLLIGTHSGISTCTFSCKVQNQCNLQQLRSWICSMGPGESMTQLINSWSVAVRHMWELPHIHTEILN